MTKKLVCVWMVVSFLGMLMLHHKLYFIIIIIQRALFVFLANVGQFMVKQKIKIK